MNRDALLELAFPEEEERVDGVRIFDLTEPDDDNPQIIHVRSTLTLSYRRIIRHPFTWSPGSGIVQASDTILVAAVGNIATDPDHRRRGYAKGLLTAAHEEAASKVSIEWAAAYASNEEAAGFLANSGYFHPAGAPDGFMVVPVKDNVDAWPDGIVDTRGRW